MLVALSRRERPIDDPAWEHLLECSPCYAEVREMQRAHVIASRDAARRRWWMAAAPAAVLVVAAGVWWIVDGRGTPLVAPSTSAALQVTLDLRPCAVTRSAETPDAPPPLELQRGVLELTLLLPVGSEPGPYDVQVVDTERRSVPFAQGEATIREFVTTLPVNVDSCRRRPRRLRARGAARGGRVAGVSGCRALTLAGTDSVEPAPGEQLRS